MSDDERRRHLALLEREQLASVMNDTKWEELASAMQAFDPLPDWRCKDISSAGPGPWDAEWCYHIRPFHTIEWLEIGFVHPKPAARGVSAQLTVAARADAETRLRATLSALGVPYSIEEGLVRVWGYTRPGAQPMWVASPAPDTATIVRRFTAPEWPLYRDLRLRALSDSPHAFGSTFDREVRREDNEWRDRLGAAARSARDLPLVAIADERPAGLAWGRLDDEQPDVAHLFQFWVAPEHRGRGIGALLLDVVLTWARSTSAKELRLRVTSGDSPAVRLYRREGFVECGEPEPLRPGATLLAQPMHLALSPPDF